MRKPTVVKGTPAPTPEVEFAHGKEIENQNIRLTYQVLNEMEPHARFPRIYKIWGDGTVTNLNLTPAEGLFLSKVLAEMFPPKALGT